MFRKRLIAIVVSIFALGVVFGIYVNEYDTFSFRALFVALIALSCVALCVSFSLEAFGFSNRIKAAALAVAAFSFGVLRVYIYNAEASKTEQFDGVYDHAVFEVREIDSNSIDAAVVSSNEGVWEGELIRIYPSSVPEEVIVGDIITADVYYRYQSSAGFYSNGISLSANGEISEHNQGDSVFCKIRRFISESSDELYGNFEHAGGVAKAVTVGDRSDLDSYVFTVYKSSGISHLLAISGLHISLIAMSFHSFLLMLSVKKKVACISAALLAVCYAFLVGFTPGAVRAAVMMAVFMLSRMMLRRADGITSLFIALFFLLILNPYSIYSVGLQLSFLCSVGIILSEPIRDRIKFFFLEKRNLSHGIKSKIYGVLPSIIAPLTVSFASSVFSFPVICTGFDTLSNISPLTNIIIVPLFSYAVGFALVAFVVAPISLSIGTVIAYPAGIMFDFVTEIARLVHEMDIGVISTHNSLVFIPLIFSLSMICALLFLSRKRVKYFSVSAVLFCFSIVLCGVFNSIVTSDKVFIEYNNKSSGEYVCIQSKEKGVYIDLGGYTSFPEAVFENGFTAIEQYVALDYSEYTFRKIDYFSASLRVSEIIVPLPSNEYEIDVYSRIKELANERNCDIIPFDKTYFTDIAYETGVEMFSDDDYSEGLDIIYIYHNSSELQIVNGMHSGAIKSDIAILTNGYEGLLSNLDVDVLYVPKNAVGSTELFSVAENFDSGIKIIAKFNESDLEIYES